MKQSTLYPSGMSSIEAQCNLVPPDSLASWRHGVAMWGQDARIGKIGHPGWPTRVGSDGDLVKPSLHPRALISPLVHASGFGLLSRCLLAVPRGDGHAMGQRTARKAKFGNVARTVSRRTPASLEEQIRSSRAIDPWLCSTKNKPSLWLGPLPHGDMVLPTWPKMAKAAKIGRSGPHSQSHISMVMASNNLTKGAEKTWGLGPTICPRSTLEVASNHFPA